MPSIDLVVLDLDGTLYSSSATTLGAVELAVRDLNARHGDVIAPPSDDLVLSGVGSTREEFARKVFPGLAEEYIGEIDDLIWHWERVLVDDGMGALFPGAVKALEEMRGMGLQLGVATNAGVGYMNHILNYFDIRRFFDDTRCAGEERTSHKGELIDLILNRLSVDPGRTVMVGDRQTDIRGARASGALAVGCTWGFASRDELKDADRLVDNFAELTDLLKSWP
ncbi:MAG: HAD family hydrolase [Candidatus Eisenbacteria bacterium]